MIKNILFTIFALLILQPIFSQTFVRMQKVNGVYEIPCKVNGIEMKFIFDTGASDISISKTEANFLAKQGLLKEDDIIGRQKYQTADGSILEGTKIKIKEIRIQDLYIQDVSATVIDKADAPLLFGQSALSKFGRYEIENDILRIYPKQSRNVYEFLNIDLTKSIEDFGLSQANLKEAKPIVGIPFEALNISKEHELRDLKFDKQSVIFDNTGKIVMVGLVKTFDSKSVESKRKESQTFYNLMQNRFTQLYGSADNEMSKISKWNKKDFEINMNVQSDFKVGVFYTPKIFISENKIPTLSSENVDDNEREMENLRSELANSINDAVSTRFDNLNAKASTKNSHLLFTFKYKIDREDIDINEFAEIISYSVLNYMLTNENAYNALKLFTQIQFEFNIINHNDDKLKTIRFLSNKSYGLLDYPLNEKLFNKLLKKYNG